MSDSLGTRVHFSLLKINEKLYILHDIAHLTPTYIILHYMIELLFVSHKTNHDISFLHLFGNLHESCTYVLERPFSFILTWAPEVQLICINPLLKHSGFHANSTRLRYSPRAHMGKMFRYDE